ncbi:MAG TPA: phosphoenolpyruvate--protein phosphotransferase [Blastocatellia bacterium]|nr:phosphoenolpyruvate--protein phosphotransferase [Blastocatellia bacterium]
MAYSKSGQNRDVRLKGLPASRGVAVGRVLRLDERGRRHFYYIQVSQTGVRAEIRRLKRAFAESRTRLKEIKARLTRDLGHQHAYILDAHLLMLEDKKLLAELEREIRDRRISAEWAVRDVADRIASAYKQVQDPYLRERASDIEDITTRLLTVLSGHQTFHLSNLDKDVIIVAEDIWPSTVAELDFKHVLAFATDSGGLTSHSAIIARAVGLPAVVGVHDLTRRVRTGDLLVVDGASGELVVRPSKPVMRHYLERRNKDLTRQAQRVEENLGPAMTLDGQRVTLRANVELSSEIESIRLFGAEGIGLYRSEYLFLNRLPDLPSEEEQYHVYRKLAEAVGEAGANIRIFDLGGDKLTLEGFEPEQNPALGLRAIRLALKVEEIFRVQLRSILRANLYGRLRIVLPLASTITELHRAKRIIDDVKAEMADASIEHNANLPVGVMIEVPAAAIMADHFAAEADFLSVGTNDLIQYLLAVDRTNENVAHLYQPLHPAVLRTIAGLVRVSEAKKVRLEVCGEMAANPIQAIALLGLGVRTLSLVPASIPLIKNAIRSVDAGHVTSLLKEAMKLSTTGDVEELLSRQLAAQAPKLAAALASQG